MATDFTSVFDEMCHYRSLLLFTFNVFASRTTCRLQRHPSRARRSFDVLLIPGPSVECQAFSLSQSSHLEHERSNSLILLLTSCSEAVEMCQIFPKNAKGLHCTAEFARSIGEPWFLLCLILSMLHVPQMGKVLYNSGVRFRKVTATRRLYSLYPFSRTIVARQADERSRPCIEHTNYCELPWLTPRTIR